MNKKLKVIRELVAAHLADELEQTLKHGWSDMVWDAVTEYAEPNTLTEEERQEIADSITWTLIDSNTGADLLKVPEITPKAAQ